MTLRLMSRLPTGENTLAEDLIHEAIEIHGDDFFYIPRTLVGKDEILGEDRISQFKNAYPIVLYVESADGYEGQGILMQKFGLTMDQSAILTVSKRNWGIAVGKYGMQILPNRPAEGDLIFYPRTKALFEIMFVNNESPFYQLGQIYVYKMTVEKFRYSSETISTGNAEIDSFVGLGTNGTKDPEVPQSFGDNEKFKSAGAEFIFDRDNPFGDI